MFLFNKIQKILLIFIIFSYNVILSFGIRGLKNSMKYSRSLDSSPQELVLISGCTGTGKSTFGMEVAIAKGILKCISTDTIRQVKRCDSNEPALHRSSYSGDGDPIVQWKETCGVLDANIESVVNDALNRGISLVLEGVHIIPNDNLINRWKEKGGTAVGVILCIPDPEVHKQVICRRGELTSKGADEQLKRFNRIRAIHDEMVRLGKDNNWLIIEQKPILEPRPLDLVNDKLHKIWVEGNSSYNILNFGEQHYW